MKSSAHKQHNRKRSKARLLHVIFALGFAVCSGGNCAIENDVYAGETPLPPLPAGAGFARIPVAGYLPAVVAWPATPAPRKLPIVVALHGSFDQPEWNCEVYQEVVRGSAVVLCPRGRLRWDTPTQPEQLRFFFPSTGGAILREAEAAVRALREASPERISDGPVIWAGFSQGAILGAPLLAQNGAKFSRAILVEGGASWTQDSARSYKRNGGERVLFACGQAGCFARASATAATLEKAGIRTQVTYAPDQGHTYDGLVKVDLKQKFAWLVEGDARFVLPAE